MHDFLIKELGRAVPYGVYDLAAVPQRRADLTTATKRASNLRSRALRRTLDRMDHPPAGVRPNENGVGVARALKPCACGAPLRGFGA